MAGSSTPRKKSSSSRPPPSGDQAVPLINDQSREQERNKARTGKQQQQQQHGSRRHDEQRPRSDRLRAKNGEKQQGRGGQKGDPKGKSRNSLARFIGKQNDTLPPRQLHAASVACSALTTPSALLRGEGLSLGNDSTVCGGGASILSADYDDASHEPLLERNGNTYSLGSSSASSSVHRDRQGKRVGFNTKYQSRNGRPNNNRGNNNDHHESSTSALSMRRSGKKPWFSSNISTSNKNRNNNNGKSFSAATGVQYRSATSTQKALEELKRKRTEVQEKRRAMSILLVLIMIAAGVHFAGQNEWSGIFGGTSSSVMKESGVRGSRDKVYGDAIDISYGGEREGFVQSALKLAKGEYKQSSPGQEISVSAGEGTATDGAAPESTNGEEDEYEYKLPEPVEKTYDDEHEFLLPLRHFADVSDPTRPEDTAFFFHVPRAGGSTMKEILGKCLKLVQSSDVGVRDGHNKDPVIQVLDVQESKYVNVDTTTIPGIQRAVDLGLTSSKLADVIVSSYFQESAALFDLTHQGRGFIVLRDPIERATSMYWHRIKEVGDLDETTTIEDYAQGNGIENNWMCRFLANRMTGELTKEDLEQAKSILKDKLLVGFIDDLDESVYRLMKYNGWKFSKDATDQMKEEDCIKDLAESGSNVNQYEYEIPKRGSQAHALISWQTQFDMKLYAYAKEVFEHQTKEWGTKERKKQLKKEKKKAKGG